MAKYVPVFGSRLRDRDAQVWGERLEHLAGEGLVTADDIVQDAQQEDSPTHSYFNWDDATAAHGYRLMQARYYMRSVNILVKDDAEPTRAFIHLKQSQDEDDEETEAEEEEPTAGYRTIQTIMANPRLTRMLLEQARRELVSYRRKYNQYAEMAKVHEHLDEAIAAMQTLPMAAAN